jgi:hypothetical protein
VKRPNAARTRLNNGQVWEDFCDRLKEAGKVVLREETPSSELDRAEGFRYLSRLTRMALENCFENSDPDFPALLNIPNPTAKAGADNPDNFYLTATICGDRDYRLRGTRGTVPLISFSTKALVAGPDGHVVTIGTGTLDGRQLQVDPDGTFEVLLSRDPRPGNWLPLDSKSNMLVVRQTFFDKSREATARLALERLAGPAKPEPLSAKHTAWALQSAAHVVNRIARRYADWAQWFQRTPNTFNTMEGSPLREESVDPNVRYLYGFWSLGPDEALVIDTPVPPCELWHLQLNNYWMESLDYRYHTVSVHKHNSRYNPDGSVTVVVAASDPGCGNYLDTAAHRCGTMVWRWTRAEHAPIPVCRVEKLARLQARARD